jgi:hypothetical protein
MNALVINVDVATAKKIKVETSEFPPSQTYTPN